VVARPSVILRIEPMRMEDLPAVHAIEAASFDAPWPPEAYQHDLETNRLAQYLVARVGDEIAAYGGMWLMVDEGHIITFAVHPIWRRQHVGGRLLLAFLDLAADRGAHEATLEVRLSNLPARRLYERFGFRPVGLRPRYYSDNGEDALIMTTDALESPAVRIERTGERITGVVYSRNGQEERIACDGVISTLPLPRLGSFLHISGCDREVNLCAGAIAFLAVKFEEAA